MGVRTSAVLAPPGLHWHEIAAVYRQPPEFAGRGYSLRPCPVQIQPNNLV